MMHRIGSNTISNIASKLWSTISIYVFVPLYIKYLGETTYGLVSFFATLQAAMNLLGLGLSNTLRREFAIGSSSDILNGTRKYKLLRSVELIYYILGIIIVLFCVSGNSFIANNWLNVENLNPDIVSIVISLMGISIAIQMVANLYAGCLFGMELQVRANIYCIVWSLFKCVGSLLIIVFVDTNLVSFYLWHIIVDIIYLLVLRFSICNKLVYDKAGKWRVRDISNIQTIWKYALGILTISFVALINKQLDKLIISKYLTITELGSYNIATTLGGISTILPSAIFIAVFPMFTNKASLKEANMELKRNFLTINKITNICISCTAFFISFFATPLIYIWTQSEVFTHSLTLVGPIVVMAIALIEYQEIPYALALAYGNTKINVIVGSVCLPIVAMATWFGIKYYGLVGASIVYLSAMGMQTLIYQYIVIKKYISNKPIKIIMTDLFLPLSLAFGLSLGFYYIVNGISDKYFTQILLAMLFGCISLIVSILLLGKNELITILNYTKYCPLWLKKLLIQ